MLETVSDRYFGSLAPERIRSASPSLLGALGDLVTLAHEAAAVTGPDQNVLAAGGAEGDRVVPHEQQPRLLSQLDRVEAVVARVSKTSLRTAPSLATPSQQVRAEALAEYDGTPEPMGMANALAEGVAPGYARMTSRAAAAREWVALERLEARVAGILEASSKGPAGANRLLGSLPEPTATRTRRQKVPRLSVGTDRRVVSEPVELAKVIAPEAMLGGMTPPELQGRLTPVADSSERYSGAVGELTTLGYDGVEPGGDSVEPSSRGIGERISERSLVDRADGRLPDSAAASRPRPVLRPVRRLGQVLAGRGKSRLQSAGRVGDLVTRLEAPDTGRIQRTHSVPDVAERAALSNAESMLGGPLESLLALVDPAGGRSLPKNAVTRLLARLDRQESRKLSQESAVREFAVSWMQRVDGSLSGVDVGLEGERTELRKFFGVTPKVLVDSSVAQESPVRGADFVTQAPKASTAPVSGDRAGLHRVGKAAAQADVGGARQRAAADALSSLNWTYVKTGSSAGTRSDLGGLAAKAATSQAAGSRVAYPLVAPAMKAVAQTALRSARSEASPASEGHTAGGPGDGGVGKEGGNEPKLDNAALKRIARSVAGHVAQLLDRKEKDRRGKWA